MDAAAPHTDPLRAFFWGKRLSQRHAIDHRVEVKGAQGTVASHAIDLSGNGVLLRVTLTGLVTAQPDLPPTDSFALIMTHFRGVFRVRFPDQKVTARAEMVRIAMEPDLPGEFLVGARFKRPLSNKQLLRLGLSPEACGPEKAADAEPVSELEA